MSDVLIDMTDPRVRIITLNRPAKRNALSVSLLQELRDAIEAARSCRVMILRAEGPAFCAGLDLAENESGDREKSAEALHGVYEAIVTSPVVSIAAAHGAAMGGGAGLVAACDLAVVADDLRLAFPEVRRGLVAALVTALIRRQVGDRVARELILLGRTIEADEARDLRLVNRVTGPADLMDAAKQMAFDVCAGAPGAIARTKDLLDELSPRPIVEDLQRAMKYHREARNSPEAVEGIRAFKEKREPRWGDLPPV
jgi:methylglutaconyl-CoA hydratase